ncbi:PilW family protein [Desulfuromonas acetoxidans]|uniref:PilW family protein n=1 Tax=Desulfuromonas acetoxidans TaxID=891 RepID=UPI00292CC832|nr:PilW family protein [Desulfuromonas acetoxidans]
MKSSRGFTLIETLIALSITLLVVGGAYTVFNSQQRNTTVQSNISDAQQVVRSSMDFMAKELRMAGYDPKLSSSFGIRDIHLRTYDLNTSAAGYSFIEFSWDKDEDGIVDNNEITSFSLYDDSDVAPGTNALMYGTSDSARQPLAGYITAMGLAFAYDFNGDGKMDTDAAGDIIWAIDAGNDNVWDRLAINTTASPPTVNTVSTGTPIKMQHIRAIRIWLLSRTEAPDQNYTDSNTYIVGKQAITPNNHYRHRLLDRVILCRNLGT